VVHLFLQFVHEQLLLLLLQKLLPALLVRHSLLLRLDKFRLVITNPKYHFLLLIHLHLLQLLLLLVLVGLQLLLPLSLLLLAD
jgi:hypothetical protein